MSRTTAPAAAAVASASAAAGVAAEMLPLLFGLVGSRFGCGGVVVLAIIVAVFGGFGGLGGMLGGGGGGAPQAADRPAAGTASRPAPGEPAAAPGQEDASKRFVRKVLASTEDTWTKLLPQQANVRYVDPRLVLYNGTLRKGSGCGEVSSASGPSYCPADRKVYLDTSFFAELAQRFGAPGDFADAYVIAHEVGHHVQNLLGISDKAEAAMQAAGSSRQRNAVSVRLELQADCFAGVWASANPNLLSPGDVDEGGSRPPPRSATTASSRRRRAPSSPTASPTAAAPSVSTGSRPGCRAAASTPATPSRTASDRLRALPPLPLAGAGDSRAGSGGVRVPAGWAGEERASGGQGRALHPVVAQAMPRRCPRPPRSSTSNAAA